MRRLLSTGFLDGWSAGRDGLAPAQAASSANQPHDLSAEAQGRAGREGIWMFHESEELQHVHAMRPFSVKS
jgi:hypothetical protein